MGTVTTTNSLKHSSHPEHPLIQIYKRRKYVCDGCQTLGSGLRFRCNDCDFDLHEFCGICPATLPSSSVSHSHQLHLVLLQIPIEGTALFMRRKCDVCAGPIRGISYRCWLCDYDAHPLCTQNQRSQQQQTLIRGLPA